MAGLIKKIRAWLKSLLSIEILSREQKLMLFAVLFYFSATGISGVFVNLFLYQITLNTLGMTASNALTNVIVFNLLAYAFMFVISCLLGIFGKRIPDKVGILFGLGAFAAMYVLLLLIDKFSMSYLILLSFLNALGSAMFQLFYNQMLGYAFPERTKKQYISFTGIVVTAVGILTPLIAGLVIQNGRNMNGYIAAFGTALVMIAVSIGFAVCVRIPKRRMTKRTYFAGVFLQTIKERNLRLMHLGELLRGLRDGALVFALPLMIFTVSSNAFAVGFYVSICAVFQLLGERHVCKTLKDENRMGLMLFAVAVMLLSNLGFVFGFNTMTIYAYGILSALVGAFLYIPIVGLLHWSTGHIVNSSKKTVEIQLVREVYLNVGKTLGALLVFAFYKLNILPAAVIVVNVILVVAWLLFSRVGEENEFLASSLQHEEDISDAD